jgi:hypothetical protein
MIPGTLTGGMFMCDGSEARHSWFPGLIKDLPHFARGVYIIEGMFFDQRTLYVGMSVKNAFSRVYQNLTTNPLKTFDPRMISISIYASENPIAEEHHWIYELRPLLNSQTRGTYTEEERETIMKRYAYPASIPFVDKDGIHRLIPIPDEVEKPKCPGGLIRISVPLAHH